VRVRYLSVHGRSDEWRWLRPHALAHSGHRWHVRAWCEKNGDYRDFVTGRMAEADWPLEGGPPPVGDAEWETIVTLTVRPASALAAEQRASVAQEYGMTDGTLTLRVRQAMQRYLERQLGLQSPDEIPRLELVR
jgi:predicted DNA-binding transcriptional regulator YafY